MAINTKFLIFSATLQDFFIDKSGKPMADGVLTAYQDNARTVLKNIYYQSGSPGAYTYIPLPNPLTLSAIGSIDDVNGVDTLIGWYPVSETDNVTAQSYYVTMYDQFGTFQWSRANFPILFNQGGGTPSLSGDLSNYIINNRFWRNVGSLTLTSVTTPTIIAPDQHDGFTLSDITFNKNAAGAVDTVTFSTFPAVTPSPIQGDIPPEFYMNHTCSGTGTEANKGYYFPISLHLATLANVGFTFTIQAQSVSGTATINPMIYAYTGTGAISPSTFTNIGTGTLTLNNVWQKYTLQGVFPSNVGLSLGKGGDDAFYLYLGMPFGASGVCNINMALPSIYLSTVAVPSNNFLTYDQIGSVTDTPRTGDVRMSLNNFQPFGWVAMNDGTIGSAMSGGTARANADTWPLYNLIWNSVLDTWAPVTGGRGANAISDFNANKPMALTKALGQVFAGTSTGNTALGTQTGATTSSAIVTHHHTVPLGASIVNITAGAVPITVLTAGPTATSDPVGGSVSSFSIVQPTVFMNFFIKL